MSSNQVKGETGERPPQGGKPGRGQSLFRVAQQVLASQEMLPCQRQVWAESEGHTAGHMQREPNCSPQLRTRHLLKNWGNQAGSGVY